MSAGSEILLQAKDNKLKVEEVEIHCRYDVESASTENPMIDQSIKRLEIEIQSLLHPLWIKIS